MNVCTKNASSFIYFHMLLANGAELDAGDEFGRTALITASFLGL